jgi:uncharacterized protein (TIGR00730 family)
MEDSQERLQNIHKILHSPSYRIAYQDVDFLTDPRMRATRFEMELLKPEFTFERYNVVSTIVVFGSTRIPDPIVAQRELDRARVRHEETPNDPRRQRALNRAERLAERSRYYEMARQFAALVSSQCQSNGQRSYVMVTGGGPGIMEAANRGAYDVQAKSIGLNIRLPMEQVPNAYITPELCFQFQYFAIRKFHFVLRAKALVAFPGGFGTLDEVFECLTLRQTRRMQEIPIILLGREYWEHVIDFQYMADEGVIDDQDLDLFRYAETAEEAWEIIRQFHAQ